jgi:hypothetical protein
VQKRRRGCVQGRERGGRERHGGRAFLSSRKGNGGGGDHLAGIDGGGSARHLLADQSRMTMNR